MVTRSALLALMLITTIPVAAEEIPHLTSHRERATSFLVISPIFSQLMAFKMPLSFHVVNEETSAHSYIREAVTTGETVDQWTQMITVTGYKGVAADPGPPPAVLLNTIADGFKQACPDTVTVGDLGSPPIDGPPAEMAFLACGHTGEGSNSHSEAALILVIKGAQDYYSIQWAERGSPRATRVVFDEKQWKNRLGQLLPVFLCDKVPGEKAPYPSCLSRLQEVKKPVDAVENAPQSARSPTR